MNRVLAPIGRVFHPIGDWLGRRTRLQLGVLCLVATLVFGVALMNKQNVLLALRRGDTVTAEFASRYKLRGIVSKVEVAGVRVGTVTGVEELAGGGAAVKMKLDKGTLDVLGSEPEAAIRPATFLGGPGLSAYVELTPGGDPGRFRDQRISRDHTHLPVEFDRVFEVLNEEARAGLTATARGLDTALAGGGKEALGAVLDDAPPALRPAAGVLGALSGSEPGDLARLVVDLGKAAAVLTETDGELEAVVEDLATVAATLGDRGPELEQSIAEMPATMAATRAGLSALDGTLARLQATAPGARPSVQRLTEVLRKLPSVLGKARPLLADLRPLAADLRPAREAGGIALAEADAALARPGNIPPGLRATDTALLALRPVMGALDTRRDRIARLVTALADIATAAGGDDARLARVLDSARETLDALADRDAELDATLAQLPAFAAELRHASTSVSALSGQLDPTLDGIKAASDRLPDALAGLSSLTDRLDRTVDLARPVVAGARPLVGDLRPLLASARPALADTVAWSGRLEPVTANLVAHLPDLQAFVYRGNSVFSLQDVNGPILRGLVIQGLDSILSLLAPGSPGPGVPPGGNGS